MLEKKGLNSMRLQTLVPPVLSERLNRFVSRERTTVCSVLREALIEFLNKKAGEKNGKNRN